MTGKLRNFKLFVKKHVRLAKSKEFISVLMLKIQENTLKESEMLSSKESLLTASFDMNFTSTTCH
jgi:hypothetical protein